MRKEEFRLIPIVYGGKGTYNSRIFLIIGKERSIVFRILFQNLTWSFPPD